jgi:hypothetical protein
MWKEEYGWVVVDGVEGCLDFCRRFCKILSDFVF